MNARTRALATVAALALASGVVGTDPAHAKPKPPDPKEGCTYNGASYSDGSVRQQTVTQTNGVTTESIYKCENGQWVHKGYIRKDPTGDGSAKRPGAPPRG